MPATRLHGARRLPREQPARQRGFAHHWPLGVNEEPDWHDDELDPFGDERWDLDTLDDDEPEPEFDDFWPDLNDE